VLLSITNGLALLKCLSKFPTKCFKGLATDRSSFPYPDWRAHIRVFFGRRWRRGIWPSVGVNVRRLVEHFRSERRQPDCRTSASPLTKVIKLFWTSQFSLGGIVLTQWKRINHKQSARWQHLSRIKASAFLLEIFFVWC